MQTVYYIGLDIHKKAISYCIKLVDGRIVRQGEIAAVAVSRLAVDPNSIFCDGHES